MTSAQAGQHLHDATMAAPGGGVNFAAANAGAGEFNGNAPVVRFTASRLRRPTQQEFPRVIIVVDARQVEGVSLSALGDYLAMVSLAQINPDSDVSALPSVLNLFNGGADAEMTAWDLSYLQGVYHMQRAAEAVHFQRADIARTMQSAAQAGAQSPQTEQPPSSGAQPH